MTEIFGKAAVDWHLDKGRQMPQSLVTSLDPADEVIGLDLPFIAEILDETGQVVSKPLIGEFDAVVENQGRLVVVDFKIAAAKWPAQKCHSDPQVTAYLMGLCQSVAVGHPRDREQMQTILVGGSVRKKIYPVQLQIRLALIVTKRRGS